jgi:hypothetical protein
MPAEVEVRGTAPVSGDLELSEPDPHHNQRLEVLGANEVSQVWLCTLGSAAPWELGNRCRLHQRESLEARV